MVNIIGLIVKYNIIISGIALIFLLLSIIIILGHKHITPYLDATDYFSIAFEIISLVIFSVLFGATILDKKINNKTKKNLDTKITSEASDM